MAVSTKKEHQNMDKYRKLSELPLNTSPSNGDLIPTIIDNGNGTFRNENIPYSVLKGAPGTNGSNGQGVPIGGSTGQVLKKTSATDYATQWSTLAKADVGLTNVDNTSDVNKPVSTAVQAAIDAAVLATKQALYPVGSIYTNATNNTNPATLLGFGTWAAFGTGRALVGIDATQTEFDVLGETGGSKTHTLTIAQMPLHSHNISLEFGTNTNLNVGYPGQYNQVRAANGAVYNGNNSSGDSNVMSGNGGGQAHNNLQPYVVVQMWQRTA